MITETTAFFLMIFTERFITYVRLSKSQPPVKNVIFLQPPSPPVVVIPHWRRHRVQGLPRVMRKVTKMYSAAYPDHMCRLGDFLSMHYSPSPLDIRGQHLTTQLAVPPGQAANADQVHVALSSTVCQHLATSKMR